MEGAKPVVPISGAGGLGVQPPEAIDCLVFEVFKSKLRAHLMDF